MIDCISVPHRTETCPSRPFEGSSKGVLLSRDDFELFVRQYADRLNSVARRFFRSIDDAADAVQDASFPPMRLGTSFKASPRFTRGCIELSSIRAS